MLKNVSERGDSNPGPLPPTGQWSLLFSSKINKFRPVSSTFVFDRFTPICAETAARG